MTEDELIRFQNKLTQELSCIVEEAAQGALAAGGHLPDVWWACSQALEGALETWDEEGAEALEEA